MDFARAISIRGIYLFSIYIQLGNFVCYKIIVIQDERSNSTPFSLPVKTEPDVYDYQ